MLGHGPHRRCPSYTCAAEETATVTKRKKLTRIHSGQRKQEQCKAHGIRRVPLEAVQALKSAGTKPPPAGRIWRSPKSFPWVNRAYCFAVEPLITSKLHAGQLPLCSVIPAGFAPRFPGTHGWLACNLGVIGGTMRRLPSRTVSSVHAREGLTGAQWSLVWRQLI